MGGTAGIQTPLIISHTITSDSTGGDDYTVTRAGTVVDAWVVSSTGSLAGTVNVGKAAAAITVTPLATGAANEVGRAADIDDANSALAAGDTLRFTGSAAAVLGQACVMLLPALADSTVIP